MIGGQLRHYEVIPLTEEIHIGQARRAVRRCALELGFGERQMAEIEIAIKEIGSNALKFGRGTGQIYSARTEPEIETAGIEIIYTDKGPGIEDTALAIEDGFTTTSSLGAGLGAIRRMADEFYIYSTVESRTRRLSLYGRTTHGTAMVLRKYISAEEAANKHAREVWGVLMRPPVGESKSGDAYVIKRTADRLTLAVIDGLGHGEGAMEASHMAAATILGNDQQPVDMIIRSTHEALRSTRGAVLGLAVIDCSAATIEYAGIGNTDFRVLGGAQSLRFISLNGTLGSRLDRVKVFKERLPKVSTIVMSTDGISERWDAESYPGLLGLHPQLLCAAIMRDYSRPNDDATMLCGRFTF